ncbi:MAG: VOC family protein [Bdellovibrionia bacterium]
MIKRMAFSVYPVKDIKASRAFYEETLGLKCTEQFGDAWFEYDVGGTCFAITNYEMPHFKAGTQGSVAFEVSDLDQMVKLLEGKGLKQAMDPIDSPVCRGSFFRDPDGNMVGLHQVKD